MTEKKPGRLTRYRDHYRATIAEHRPVPVLLPFLVITVLALVAYLFLDPLAGGMYGRWPAALSVGSAIITDIARSGWILAATTIVILCGWTFRRFSTSETASEITARIMAMAAYILVSVGLAALIVNIFKRAIGRPRPVGFADHGLFSFNPFTWNFDFESFPSGHSTVAGALFMALALLLPRFRWPLLAIGLCLALTRVLIGVHYPSDVAVGFGFGMWFAFAAALFFSRIGVLFETSDGHLLVKT